MKRITLFLPAILLLGMALGGCSPAAVPPSSPEAPAVVAVTETPTAAGPLAMTDGRGRTIQLPTPAQRVVTLAPSNTEILFAIGAGAQVVGRDMFSDYPPEAGALPNIGGDYVAVDTETLLTLAPDLVLAADLNPVEQIQALEDLGLTVFVLGNPTDLQGLYVNLLTVGTLTGHAAEAAALAEALQERVAAIQARLANVSSRPLVFYELDNTDPNAPWTSGPGTFLDTLIQMAGGENVGGILGEAWAQISLEELIAQDPDIILLGDYLYGGVTPEQVAARPGWEALSAVKNQRVFTFDDNLVSRPGPRLVDGLEALAKLLHPEAFE